MIYVCEECDFLFRRSQPQTQCPFCEKTRVREVMEEEKKRFEQVLETRGKAARRLACEPNE